MTTIPAVVLHLIDDLPEEYISHMADLLRAETRLDWDRLFRLLRAAVSQIETQERVRLFIAEWQAVPQPPSPIEMSVLLQSVSAALTYQRQKQKIELTWTGPRSSYINMRRTDQALIELINAARTRILIVSFAVYKARNILSTLEKAAKRGVEITIILESPEPSEGKNAYSTIRALGAALRDKSKVFIWPYAKRVTTPDGKIGSLHAKVCVADGNHLFLSSANLTDYAMNLNMEMGLLLFGSDLPVRIESHFGELIANGTLAEIAPDK